MKAQMSLEYVFAVFMWVLVCTAVAYAISPYVSVFSSQSLIRAYSAAAQSAEWIAASDVDGLRYVYKHNRIDGNLTFSNTSIVLKVGKNEVMAESLTNYTYSDVITRGDNVLIRSEGGSALAVKVS
ncbi:MAG: hypothetical protein V1909_04020 [Candidatus Micrarchaeota archaeon]